MKRKERTNEEKVARGKAVLALLLGMSLIILAGSIVNRCGRSQTVASPDEVMDRCLPSLLKARDYTDATVLEKGNSHKRSYVPICEAEDSLMILEFRLAIGDVPKSEVDSAMARIESLKETVKAYKEDPDNIVVNHNRRIKFLYDGKTYSCIQVIDTNLVESHLKHIICLDDIDLTKEYDVKLLEQEIQKIFNAK